MPLFTFVCLTFYVAYVRNVQCPWQLCLTTVREEGCHVHQILITCCHKVCVSFCHCVWISVIFYVPQNWTWSSDHIKQCEPFVMPSSSIYVLIFTCSLYFLLLVQTISKRECHNYYTLSYFWKLGLYRAGQTLFSAIKLGPSKNAGKVYILQLRAFWWIF